MANYGIVPKTFDGISLQTSDYTFDFVEDAQTLDSPGAQGVEASRPGRTPLHSFMQPDGARHIMEANITTIDQDTYDSLKGVFDTLAGGVHTLIVTDKNSVDRRLTCTIEKWAVRTNVGNTFFAVSLRNAPGYQLSDTAADDTTIELDDPADTFTLTNDGNTGAPLVLTLSPEAAIDEDDGYHLGRRIYLANRSEQPLTHFAAEGYAIEITGGGLDTAALEGAGKVLDSLDDLRVWLNGRELLRWCDPATSDAATKIWCNIAMRPGRFATLAAGISDSDTYITTESIDGFAGWDNAGWVYVDDEPCVYAKVDDFTLELTHRPSAASHSAAVQITWIEHVLTLTYGFTAADTPSAGADSKPVIDLSASSNTEHHWPGPFFNANDRRSMTFRRIVEGDQSPHIRGWDDGDNMVFEDLLPETGKPLADSVEVRFPVPCVGPVVLDRNVDYGLLLQGFASDLTGNESQLIDVLVGSDIADAYSLDNEMTRLRLKAKISAILGEMGDQVSVITLNPTPAYWGPGHGEDSTDLYTRRLAAVHFTLDQDTEIIGFIAKFDTGEATLTADLISDDKTKLIFVVGFLIAASGEWSAAGLTATIPAGGYWLIFNYTPTSGDLLTRPLTKARIFTNYTLLPGDYAYEDTAFTDIHFDSNGNGVYNAAVSYPGYVGYGDASDSPAFATPLFAVLSKKQDPQADAPLETGNTISIDNIIAPLDSTRAPLIVMGSEFNLFPIIGTLANNETGDAVSLSFLCKATEEIEIDFDNGLVTDNETGLDACSAVEYSNPTRRMYLAKGDNEFEIAIAGVSASAKLDVTPTYRHAWL